MKNCVVDWLPVVEVDDVETDDEFVELAVLLTFEFDAAVDEVDEEFDVVVAGEVNIVVFDAFDDDAAVGDKLAELLLLLLLLLLALLEL